MNLTRCNQGHFYDADKHPAGCPHCGGNGGQAPMGGAASGTPTMAINPVNNASAAPAGANMHTVPLNPQATPAATVPMTPPQAPAATTPLGQASNGGGLADDVGKTVGFFTKKTNGGTEPVTGWLVCVEGKHYGEDFKIKMGKNSIGRSNTMDIVLAKDTSVSREKHAIVVYEPNENIFILLGGESKELCYLNGQVVLSPQVLKMYDKIKLGSSVLMFVPLCGEGFIWKED